MRWFAGGAGSGGRSGLPGATGGVGTGGCWGWASATPRTERKQNESSRRRRDRSHDLLLRASIKGIDGKAAQELGVEVGGLLGHHVSGKGDLAQLIERDGIHEEGNVGAAFGDLLDRLAGIAEVAKVALLADRFGSDAEELIQHQRVKADDIELALARRQRLQRFVSSLRA